MFGFNENDINRLSEGGDRAFKEQAAAKAKLEKALPEWEKRTANNALLAAGIEAFPHVATHDTPDLIWKSYEAKLRAQLQADVRDTDALIVPLSQEFERTKQELFAINSRLIGSFQSYAGRVAAGLPETHKLRTRLEEARRQVGNMTLKRTSEILAVIHPLIDAVEGDSAVDAPIFRFGSLITPALGKSEGGI